VHPNARTLGGRRTSVRSAVVEPLHPHRAVVTALMMIGVPLSSCLAIWGGRPAREGRGSRTSDERLARVAEIYVQAVGDGRPPVQAVAAELPCSRSHAGRLVAQARAAGQLRCTSPGRASATKLEELTLVEALAN
jgi:hypothetical protein